MASVFDFDERGSFLPKDSKRSNKPKGGETAWNTPRPIDNNAQTPKLKRKLSSQEKLNLNNTPNSNDYPLLAAHLKLTPQPPPQPQFHDEINTNSNNHQINTTNHYISLFPKSALKAQAQPVVKLESSSSSSVNSFPKSSSVDDDDFINHSQLNNNQQDQHNDFQNYTHEQDYFGSEQQQNPDGEISTTSNNDDFSKSKLQNLTINNNNNHDSEMNSNDNLDSSVYNRPMKSPRHSVKQSPKRSAPTPSKHEPPMKARKTESFSSNSSTQTTPLSFPSTTTAVTTTNSNASLDPSEIKQWLDSIELFPDSQHFVPNQTSVTETFKNLHKQGRTAKKLAEKFLEMISSTDKKTALTEAQMYKGALDNFWKSGLLFLEWAELNSITDTFNSVAEYFQSLIDKFRSNFPLWKELLSVTLLPLCLKAQALCFYHAIPKHHRYYKQTKTLINQVKSKTFNHSSLNNLANGNSPATNNGSFIGNTTEPSPQSVATNESPMVNSPQPNGSSNNNNNSNNSTSTTTLSSSETERVATYLQNLAKATEYLLSAERFCGPIENVSIKQLRQDMHETKSKFDRFIDK